KKLPETSWKTELRHSEIARVGHSVVQTDGRGVEILVLREESLKEPIPPAAKFDEQSRRFHQCIRKREQVDRGRRERVVAGCGATAGQAQREALVAVAVKVAARQQVLIPAKVLVNLKDQAVH